MELTHDLDHERSHEGDASMNLRPKTMFAMKGRARPSETTTENYLPQWSKDGDGFKKTQSKTKVLRYTREELLTLHVVSTTPPDLPEGTPVISQDSLPPVANLPFDYEEIYKQWALNRNRGRGRGRATGDNNTRGGHNNQSNNGGINGSRNRASSMEESQDKTTRHGSEEDTNGRRWGDKKGDDNWERGIKPDATKDASNDLWDDVDTGGDTMDMGLSDFALAAEQFRHEMDELHRQHGTTRPESKPQPSLETEGQFEDSVEEEEAAPLWDMPAKAEEDDQTALAQSNPLADLAGMSWNMSPTPPLRVVVPPADAWFYLDPQGLQQGPFKSAEMREWFEAGYFKPHLPIRFGHEGEFASLANHFRHGQIPFASLPSPNPQAQAHAQALAAAKAQEQARQQQLLVQQKQLEQQQYLVQQQRLLEQRRLAEERMRMEMQRLEMNQHHLHHQQQHQQQHHLHQEHARMALLQQQQQLHHQQLLFRQHQQQMQHQQMQQQAPPQPQPDASAWQQNQRNGILAALGMFDAAAPAPATPEPAAAPEPAKPSTSEAVPESNAWVKNAASPKRPPSPAKEPEAPVAAESPKPKAKAEKKTKKKAEPTPTPTWGGESPQAPSLKQIQEEEQKDMRRRLQKAADPTPEEQGQLADMGAQLKMMLGVQSTSPKQPTKPVASAWKAAAAPVDAPKKSLRDILAEEERLALLKASQAEGQPKAPSRWSSVVTGAAPVPPPAPKIVRAAPSPSPPKPEKPSVDAAFWNFEAKKEEGLSDDLMAWCGKQLKKLGVSDDLTLIQYCATLEDSGEIRETLAANLGSTPKVSAFATEFIQKKHALAKVAKSTPRRGKKKGD
ncbi:hypothetical protein ACHHYP_07503 [Achlya hypogyna]|uniref:GYF domain-containing protein n=1 Tax=Achlya hypogyna TaxID=1202772 RepID=A0A1V9ZM27_ACHHY|nr:hypothetical protein ACHHYP_07503 [Achlya hypogyna]